MGERPQARRLFFGDGITRRSASSQSARVRRRAPLCGGRLACRAVAPLRVVKMQRRSLRSSFLRNYRKALSFSLRMNEIGQERRTEGIAIVTQSVNRVIPPPRAPAESIFGGANRAGFSVSTVRRSIMSVRDSNFFQKAESKSRILGGRYPNRTRGRKARMGLPAKCMHFVGSPGWRGNSNSPARRTAYSERLRAWRSLFEKRLYFAKNGCIIDTITIRRITKCHW